MHENQMKLENSSCLGAWQAHGKDAAERVARRTIAEAIIKRHRWRYWRPCFPWSGGWQHFDTKFWEPEEAENKLFREISAFTSAFLDDLPPEVRKDLVNLGDLDQAKRIERMLRWRLGWPPAPQRIVPFKDEEHARRDGVLVYGMRSIADRIEREANKIAGTDATMDLLRATFRAQANQLRQLADAQESDGHVPDFGHTVVWSDGSAS